ncbi:MAG TPA: GNAT family N-acetyltransferase [Solirubrobacteraceae bacterium]|nr:GNAT family N-acetyltransferase [Solirubrobacteraceae bacterium]
MDVFAAQADAWQALGGLFAGRGGGVGAARGVRMMASGLAHPQWNSGDVSSPDADVEAARDFYASLGMRWGLRVPDSVSWERGRRIGGRRLMWLPAGTLRAAQADVAIAAAGPGELEEVLAVDCAAFGSDPVQWRPWTARLLEADDAVLTYALARAGGEAVGSGYCVHAAGGAQIAGVAVLEHHRRRGIGAAITSWLLERAFSCGARLAHLSPDDERAASVYRRLGFEEAEGFGIWLDVG